jgi:hypothetical protein
VNIAAQLGKIGVAAPSADRATSEQLGRIAILALTGLEAPLRLVDDVDAALAPHEAIVAVAAAQRFQ